MTGIAPHAYISYGKILNGWEQHVHIPIVHRQTFASGLSKGRNLSAFLCLLHYVGQLSLDSLLIVLYPFSPSEVIYIGAEDVDILITGICREILLTGQVFVGE